MLPGNRSALSVVVWKYNVPKMLELALSSFPLGDWTVTSHRAERDGMEHHYARLGLWMKKQTSQRFMMVTRWLRSAGSRPPAYRERPQEDGFN